MTTPSAAANAYASLARIADASGGLGKAVGETNGPSFGALLKDAVGSVLEAGKASDAQQRAMVAGKANINVIGATRRMIQRTLDILKV